MMAILPPTCYQEWLEAKSDIMGFMLPFDAWQLRAAPAAPVPARP